MKTYLPSTFINNNYRYKINGDYFTIITNNNCFSQYSNTYCDCYNVYPKLDYINSEVSSCNINTNYVTSDKFSSDIYYRIDFVNIMIIFCIFAYFIIFLPYKIMSRLFGRWLKL